jgi:hypothetical protein
MAKQTINLGASPTGVGGDTPRSAFTKAQANFDEIYTALGGPAIPAALPIDRGGTGGATAAAARTSLGLKTAAVVDVLGTVTQAAGGAIIETGSNANGTYTKFADGTLICRNISVGPSTTNQGAAPACYSNAVLFGFPVAFIQVPSVSLAALTANGYFAWAAVEGGTTTTLTSARLVSPAANMTAYLSYIAVGRWF